MRAGTTSLKIGDDHYDVYSPLTVEVSKMLTDIFVKLGKPDSPLSSSGKKMMQVIIAVWQDLYPEDAKKWSSQRKEYKLHEKTTAEQIKGKTGRSLASIPYPVYRIMQAVFPTYLLDNRKKVLAFIKEYPLFQMANKV